MSTSNHTIVKRPMRYFVNSYLCEDCPNEWADSLATVAPSWCPCCDRECEPYHSEERWEMAEVDVIESVHVTRHEYCDRRSPRHTWERIQGWQATFNGPDEGAPAGDGRTPLAAIAELFNWEGIDCDPATVTIIWE